MKKFVMTLAVCLTLILAAAVFAADRPRDIRKIGPQDAGQIAFVQEVNQTAVENGISTNTAKEIVWREWNSQQGDHYDHLMLQGWQWKSWYGYATLFSAGCAIGYMLM